LSRAVATWADRWLEQRRTREILGLILILGIFLVQFGAPAFSRWATGERFAAGWRAPILRSAHLLDHVLPPGLAGAALANAASAGRLAAIANFLFVCLYALAFFWLLHLRLAAQYRGENLSEARVAPSPAGRARAAGPSAAVWRLPWRSSATAALVEREARYTMRNWPVLFQLFLPVFFVFVLGPKLRHSAPFDRDAAMAFPVAVAYAFFIQTNWVFNSLGYDGTGIRFLLLAPVRFRQVMIGKNLFQGAAMLGNVLLLGVCVRWLFGPVNLLMAAATLFAALYGLLVNLAVGNVISVRFPTRREFGFGNIRRGRSRGGTAGIVGLLTQILIIASAAAVFLMGKLLDRMDLAVLIFLALVALAAAGYALTLQRIDRLALAHRESLIEELCRTEAAS
jgi:ABC-2 type transport system permease protein